MTDIKLLLGDCIEQMKGLEDNSVDSIVTDPPYELGFMGKSWDNTGIANNPEMWAECLRVLKPGGHLLAFSGTRTYHRMAVAIEDAGFEVRDMIEWVYGSGFPKSLNIGKSINKLETKEWNNISKAIDNIDKSSIFALWKNNSSNVKIVETQSQKNAIEIGICMPKNDSVQESVMESLPRENNFVSVIIAELNLCEALLLQIETKEHIATLNVEANTKQLQSPAESAESLSQSQNHKSLNIFTAQCDVKEWLNENTEVNHKVEEAIKTLRGNKKYSNEEITNVLCAVIQNVLKHTILSQSKTFHTLDTNQQTECASAINVTITEYIMECLITNTVDILKSKAVDKLQGNERESIGKKLTGTMAGQNGNLNAQNGWKGGQEWIEDTKGTSEWEGWGTALKPAHEPICMARKPLAEKTVAENVLKYGTGGINIDISRVDKPEGDESGWSKTGSKAGENRAMSGANYERDAKPDSAKRFPANLIHDNSEEVRECFPETKSQGHFNSKVKMVGHSLYEGGFKDFEQEDRKMNDSGNASRFFKSIIYTAKAGKAERNRGCEGRFDLFEQSEGLEEKETKRYGDFAGTPDHAPKLNVKNTNNHPTVKPIALMEYLINMVTPKGATVLDPFMGSGTTGVAAKKNQRKFIGIEKDEQYFTIAEKRIKEN